jgi:hypothetical protein
MYWIGGWKATEPVWRLCKREYLLPLPENRPTDSSVGQRVIVAIPTELYCVDCVCFLNDSSLQESLPGVTVKTTDRICNVFVSCLLLQFSSVHLRMLLIFPGTTPRTKRNAGPRKFKRFPGKKEHKL